MREDWKYLPLGKICDILDSKRKPITKNKRLSGSIPYYGATGVLDYVKDYIFNEKLVLLGEDGAKWGAGENSAYIIDGKSWVNNHVHALRPHRNIIVDEFIVYYLNFTDLSDSITGVTVPKLNQEKMRAISIPVPPLAEQERIVSLLDTQFAKIDALKANAASQLQAAKDLFQAALKQLLTPQEGWDEKTLGDIGEFTRGGNFTKSDFVSEGIPCIHYGQVHMHFGVTTEKTLSYLPKDFPKVKYAKQGDLIIAITSEDDEGSCKCTAWLGNEDVAVGGHIAVYHHSLDPKFMSYYFRSPKFQTEKLAFTHGFKVVEIKPSDIAKIPIIYPKDKNEQHKIVSRLDAISEKVKALQANYDQTINLCNDLKQSLLKSIFA